MSAEDACGYGLIDAVMQRKPDVGGAQ
jgi:ATP-dependent protease ClpP protease subunit